MKTFKIIPILGRKTDVLPDDTTMLKMVGDGVALSHDAGGYNFDLSRKRNACSKSYGKTQRSNTVNASATRCMGLFELYDGTNRNNIYFDNGVVYYYDGSWDPVALADTYLNYDAQTGSFTAGNSIIGATSGATADIVFVYDAGSSDGTLFLENVSGTFQDDEIIYEASYGGELLTNGDFANWTGDDPDDWTVIEAGDASSNITENPAGQCQIISDGTLTSIAQDPASEDGSFYKIATDIKTATSGALVIQVEGEELGTYSTTGVKTVFAQAVGTSMNTTFKRSDAMDITIDDCSVKKATNAALANGTVSTTTFANDSADLYSTIRIGSYMAFADRAENTPMKWQHGDGTLSTLVASGTQYKFRHLLSFQRRVVGLYSDQTNGNIDVRWSTAWPATAITSLNFPAANQLYIPNDDPITGGAVLNRDKAFIFCENSIQQLVYYPDYSAPFRCYTVVPYHGATNHHSIVGREGVLTFYNKDYGFCEYYGGESITPISDDIKDDLKSMNTAYLPLIVGCHYPYERKILWTAPLGGQSECDHIVSYQYDTKQWEILDRSVRYIDKWKCVSSLTWTDFIVLLGGTGATWEAAGSSRWADYISENDLIVYGGTDGHLYTQLGESLDGSNIDGYRIEPILYFGNKRRFDTILSVWFDIGLAADFSIDVYHRSGNTAGELIDEPWTSLGSVSCNDPYNAELKVNKNARMHQFKWGTDLLNESFVVNGMVFKYQPGSDI